MADNCTNCDDSAAKFKIVEKPVGVPVGRWITPMVRRNGQVAEMFPGEKINPCWLPDQETSGSSLGSAKLVAVADASGAPQGMAIVQYITDAGGNSAIAAWGNLTNGTTYQVLDASGNVLYTTPAVTFSTTGIALPASAVPNIMVLKAVA